MPTSITKAGLRGLARRIDAGRLQADPKARQQELGKLIDLYAQNMGDAGQMGWLKSEVPALHAWLEQVPRNTLVRASTDPRELLRLAADLDTQVSAAVKDRSGWVEAGLSASYEDQARGFHKDKKHEFLQDIKGETRFCMPELSYRPLVDEHAEDGLFHRLTNRNLKDDLVGKLLKLGVPPDDVSVGEKIQVQSWARDIDELHIPPLDAALLMDAHTLSERGAQLGKTSAPSIRRVGGAQQAANVFQMGAEDFLGMRGVRYGMPDDATAQDICDKCNLRLKERGVDAPAIQLLDVDGQATLRLTTEQARVLLAPIADGDPACRLSVKPMDRHDPRREGYDPETGVFLTQAAMLAYEDQDSLAETASLWGLTDAKLIENKDTDAQGFVAFDKSKNAVVVAFRGTESQADALTDADIRTRRAGRYGEGEVHEGFRRQLDSILGETMDEVRALLKDAPSDPPPTVMIGGHSLGGALGALFAGVAVDEGLPVGAMYTCGQPKLGTEEFTTDLGARLKRAGVRYYRYVNNSDAVARVPPTWDHGDAGVEIYIDRLGRAHAPGTQDEWAKFGDRARAATLNLLQGNTFDAGPDAFTDHRCKFYVGFVRKNRTNDLSG